MKGAKGGKRDKRISFLFSKKNAKNNDNSENLEISSKNNQVTIKNSEEKIEEKKIEENEQTTIVDLNLNKDAIKEEVTMVDTPPSNENKEHETTITKEIKIDEKQILPDVRVEEKEEEITLNTDVLEKVIVETIEKIVTEDLEELEEIAFEIEVLNDKKKEEVITDETEKLKDELQSLLEKFEKIKNKYYPQNKPNELVDIDDELIYDLLQDYKDEIKISNIKNEVSKDIEKIQNYITVMKRITDVETKGEDIDEEIDQKLDEFEIRDEEFEIMKDEYSDIESVQKDVEKFNKEQDSIIKSLEDKIAQNGDITKRTEINYHVVTHLNRLIEAALIFSLSRRIPPTPRGRLIRASMIISAASIASRFLTNEQTRREITTVKYTDFSKDIITVLKSVGNVEGKIDNAFSDIDDIRQILTGKYGEFAGKLDEYDNLIANLDNMEKELDKQKTKIQKYKIEFKNVLDKNNEKIKRLEAIERAA